MRRLVVTFVSFLLLTSINIPLPIADVIFTDSLNVDLFQQGLLYNESEYVHAYATKEAAEESRYWEIFGTERVFWQIQPLVRHVMEHYDADITDDEREYYPGLEEWVGDSRYRGVVIHSGEYGTQTGEIITIGGGVVEQNEGDFIDIVGENEANVIISANRESYCFLFSDNSHYVRVYNLTVVTAARVGIDAGFSVTDGNNILIYNCTIKDCHIGALISGNSQAIFKNCSFHDNSVGIEISGTKNTVSGCSFRNNTQHIIVFGDNNWIVNCTLAGDIDAVYGIRILGDSNIIWDCDIKGTANSIAGIYLMNCWNNTITGNSQISNFNNGIIFSKTSSSINTSNNVVRQCTIVTNRNHGIELMTGVEDNNIVENDIFGNGVGIYAGEGTIQNLIYKNKFKDNEDNSAEDDNCRIREEYKNMWYNESLDQGNYWWNHQPPEHPDENGDRVIEDEYLIPGRCARIPGLRNWDKYPLVWNVTKVYVSQIFPVGGECFKDDNLTIRWNAWTENGKDEKIGIVIKYGQFNPETSQAYEWIPIYEGENTGSFPWSIANIPNDFYALQINATYEDEEEKCYDCSDTFPFSIWRDGPTISKITITDADLTSTDYVNDGDTVIIEATICGNGLREDYIFADLSDLGGNKTVPPTDTYTKSGLYVWIIDKADIATTGNTVYITVEAADSTGTAKNIGFIGVDTTGPQKPEISRPYHGIYLFDQWIIPFPATIVLGEVTVEISVVDNESGLDKLAFYIGNSIINNVSVNNLSVQPKPDTYTWEWTGTGPAIGKFYVKAYDKAGNSKSSDEIFVFKIL